MNIVLNRGLGHARLWAGLRTGLGLGLTALLVACGGGGSDAGSNPQDGAGGGGGPKAADLTLTLSAPTISNSGSDTITATVTAVDANRNTVSGIPVTIRVDSAATVNVSGSATDTSGVVTANVRIGDSKINRVITVTAVSGTLSRSQTLQVTGAKLTATLLPAVLTPGQAGQVQFRLLDASGNGIGSVPIVVTGVGGVQVSATTAANGEYVYAYTAPSAAGTLDIRASAAGVESLQSVLVQSGPGVIPAADVLVRSASMQASPVAVAVNATGSAVNRTELRVLFVGQNNVAAPRIRVRFDENGRPPAEQYGSFISGANLIYSGSNGVATSAFVPGDRGSAPDAVVLRACWDYVDFAAGTCPRSVSVNVTISADPLSVSIGTNELIEEPPSGLTYARRFVVQVVDSAGVAKPDVLVSPVIDLLRYRKGAYIFKEGLWQQDPDFPFNSCDNEDLNRNGASETYADGHREDVNLSEGLTGGRAALEPRRADISLSVESPTGRTNSLGQVILRIEYPRNLATWVLYNLQVGATVGGSEGRANFVEVLPAPASILRNPDLTPAFVRSPYGILNGAPILYTWPQDGRTYSLCTNPN